MPGNKKSVLFICLGNICRSPIAEAVFCHVIRENGVQDQWEVDSAAIGSWHVGRSPDRRALAVLEKHGIPTSHKARQIKTQDFSKYDYIFGMDEENMEDLNARAPNNCKAKIELLGKYDPEGELIIRDPYYDHNDKGFEKCYEQSLRCCRAFLEQNS